MRSIQDSPGSSTTAQTPSRRGAAIVGTGWGALTHVPALRAAGFEPRLLVGTDPQRTAERAAAAGVPLGTTDLGSVLSDPTIDLVTVATPPETHADIVVQAATAGKHVLCEKPFAHSVDDAVRMRAAVRKAGVIGVVGHEFRWLPNPVASWTAVRSGLVGEPRLFTHIRLSSTLAGPDASVPDWFENRSSNGGWLNAEVQHVIDEVRMLFGEIATVTAWEGQTSDHPWPASDSFSVQFTTRAGAFGTILSSVGSPPPGLNVQRITGSGGALWTNDQGTVSVDDGTGPRVLDTPAAQLEPLAATPADESLTELVGSNSLSKALARASGHLVQPTARMYQALQIALTAGEPRPAEPPLPTFDDGVANTAVHMAILASIDNGKTVHVPSDI